MVSYHAPAVRRTSYSDAYDGKRIYNERIGDRAAQLSYARWCSAMTVRHILPMTRGQQIRLGSRYSDFGGRITKGLASRLLLGIMPPNAAAFRFAADPLVAYASQQDPKVETEWNVRLQVLERRVLQLMETYQLRTVNYETILHTLIAGNVAKFYDTESQRARNFALDQFVVERSGMGEMICLVIEEMVSERALTEPLEDALWRRRQRGVSPPPTEPGGKPQMFAVYTVVEKVDRKFFEVSQYLEDEKVPEYSTGRYRKEQLPYHVIRCYPVSGEAYSTSFVQDHYADLKTNEGYAKSALELGAASARCIFAAGAGSPNPKDIKKANNLDIVTGNGDMVKPIRLDKANDFSVFERIATMNRRDIGISFMDFDATRREGERVTAEENLLMAQEVDRASGGLLSSFAVEISEPELRYFLNLVQEDPKTRVYVNEEIVYPKVITGLEALGRAVEFQRLQAALQLAVQTVGPERMAEYLRTRPLLQQIFMASGADAFGLISTENEVAALRHQAMVAQQNIAAAPQVVAQAGKAVNSQLDASRQVAASASA